jgi:malonyl-CoA decarboxylase
MLSRLLNMPHFAWRDQPLKILMDVCEKLLSERGQANVFSLAQQVMTQYRSLPISQQEAFFSELSIRYSLDPEEVLTQAKCYAEAPTTVQLAKLTRAVEPPRQELLRRINRTPGGTAFLLAMRNDLLRLRKTHPELDGVDADFLHLLSSWFNPGFLHLKQVDWNSSAALLEKIMQYEAVHEITDWNDLRRRLLPDRRCYAFFHPQLPEEPLIYVEIALVEKLPSAIFPLIDKDRQPDSPTKAKTAVFYSISNCQPGLRGVSLGNFLIKKVAGLLHAEFPQIKTYCTLSPIPTFTRRLQQDPATHFSASQKKTWSRVQSWMKQHDPVQVADIVTMTKDQQDDLRSLCAHFLVQDTHSPLADPVARFHLDNGARLEHIQFAANLSPKGLQQSYGLMVNYVYEINLVESRHQQYLEGRVSHSREVGALVKR